MDPYLEAKSKVKEAVLQACRKIGLPISEEEVIPTIEDARAGFGDIACTIAFQISKKQKTNPAEVAKSILGAIDWKEFSDVKIVGPYINFYLEPKYVSDVLSNINADEKNYGKETSKETKVMVEFPSVNPNKPWHVGHLRNALLGDTISRILEFSGYDVQRIDYIDDLGLQVARSLWSFLNVDDVIEGKADQWLGIQYVNAAKEIEKQSAEEDVRKLVKEIEDGKSDNAVKGRQLCEKCVKAQQQTAYALSIYHDALIWESDIVKTELLERAMIKMLESGAVEKETEGDNKGCVVAKLGEENGFKDLKSPDKVLMRSDGTATYIAKDIAFHMWKFGIIESPFKFDDIDTQPNGQSLFSTGNSGKDMPFGDVDIVVNIIGVEQKYPQKVLKTLLKAMGYEKESLGHVHLAYEHAWLPDSKFSGRDGTWMGYSADDVITEAEKRAYTEIKERFKDMNEKEKRKIAMSVGTGAIRFSFIRTTPEKKLIFKWEEALSFEGDSAPYVQYSHARASRILEKTGDMGKPDYSLLKDAVEIDLVKLLSKFPSVVSKSAREYRPNYIAEYALDVATLFNKFYNLSPVLKAEGELRSSRLGLVNATRTVLLNSLSLLGIDAPDRM